MIEITKNIILNAFEIKMTFIASPGPGGQNVNKLATAVYLRFDVLRSPSLSKKVRERLISVLGKRLTQQGELIIKANRFRTQERNKQDALERLSQWIRSAAILPKKRKETKPTLSSKRRRLDTKKKHGVKKTLRGSRDW